MKRAVPILVLLIAAAVPMSGQSRAFDLTGNVVWLDTSSEGTFDDTTSNPVDVNFDGTVGYGLAANIFFGERISTEFAISRVNTDVTFDINPVILSAGLSLRF